MWTLLLLSLAALVAAIYCITKAVIDLRAGRYVWGSIGLISAAVFLMTPIQTHPVKVDLPVAGPWQAAFGFLTPFALKDQRLSPLIWRQRYPSKLSTTLIAVSTHRVVDPASAAIRAEPRGAAAKMIGSSQSAHDFHSAANKTQITIGIINIQ
jgi:hypothetical protein